MARKSLNELLKKAGLDFHDLWDGLWDLAFAENNADIASILASMFGAKDVDILVQIGLDKAKFLPQRHHRTCGRDR
jgi:hypothetical protein